MSEYNISNKDLSIFLAVTFGFTIVMGIAMSFAYTKYNEVSYFALVQMYYPAIGVITALLLSKKRRKELPMKFYITYLCFTITSVLFVLAEVFVFHQTPGTYTSYLSFVGTISLALIYFSDGKEKMDRFGLGLSKNIKASLCCIVLSIILHIGGALLSALIFGGFKEAITPFRDPKTLITIFLLPLSFPLQFVIFLGEEYGWRYFLQTALQERLGKRKGVILVGFIWGIWHLPLNLFYYSPTAPLYSVIIQVIGCIGSAIFWGFVYMKTKSIWTTSIIHFMNNAVALLLSNNIGVDTIPGWQSVLESLIFTTILYGPFLFTKEYRKTEEKTLNYNS